MVRNVEELSQNKDKAQYEYCFIDDADATTKRCLKLGLSSESELYGLSEMIEFADELVESFVARQDFK